MPEGEDPYWCPYCVVANAFPSPAEEPPPVCRLCGGRGGGLIRAIVGEDGTTEEGEPSPPRPPQPPQFVHKTCALAGMGRSQGPVRFLAGSNGGVALLSSTALRAATSVKTEEEEGGDRPQRCRHCGAGDGLLLPCRGAGGEGGCPLAAHASCAFEAAAAALLVDAPLPQPPKTTTPPVHIWCSLEHAPPPEQANPGADAVAACLGLLPPVGSQPALPPSAAPAGEGKVVQAPQHFRGAAALFGGYLDDKAKLLLLAREQGKLGRDGASRVVLVGRQQQQQAGAGGSGGGVQVVYALRDAGSLLPPPETPRAGTAQEQAEMEVDTSE